MRRSARSIGSFLRILISIDMGNRQVGVGEKEDQASRFRHRQPQFLPGITCSARINPCLP
jgi:hypothetical protein